MISDDAVLLLDTCAIVFMSLATTMDKDAKERIGSAAMEGRLRLSPMSAWEIGMLMSKGRLRSPLTTVEFLGRFCEHFNAGYCELTPDILIESSFLPEHPHGDPADRILIASARKLDMVLVTRDGHILSYGGRGHLRTLNC